MSVNTVLILICLIVLVAACIIMYVISANRQEEVYIEDFNKIEDVVDGVKSEMVELIKEDISSSATNEEFEKMYKRKARINDALKKCVYGIDSAKMIVIDLIREYIDDHVSDEKVDVMLGLDDESEPSDQIIFEILMYRFKKKYGKDALGKWIDKYDFARERPAINAARPDDMAYFITSEDLQMSYLDEKIDLSDDERRDVLAVLVYQLYKGFGVIDTLREMNINGINIGVSGSIMATVGNNLNNKYRANNAVWLQYNGRYIHLQFMGYGNEDELKRIVQLLIRWNNPGALTSKRGYLVNTMYDKSRILAIRPPASEYWAAFIRKFTLSDLSPESLLIKDNTVHGEYPIKLLEFLIRGEVSAGVTGQQGSGKTTLMSSIMRYVDPRYNIRVLELAPELYLRELYPTRNILSVNETTTVTAAELQDALKKSDSQVSIVGEVATDAVAARMIQFALTGSLFSIFSHHATTAKGLVLTLRNSLAAAGGFDQMEIAEKQVIDAVHMDIHLDRAASGERFIERITEIIPLETNTPYPELDPDNLEETAAAAAREYYYRQTDRISFTTRDILVYDKVNHEYKMANRISTGLERHMRNKMDGSVLKEFDLFTLQEWGPRPPEDGVDEIIKAYDPHGMDYDTALDILNGRVDIHYAARPSQEDIENADNIADMFDALDADKVRENEQLASEFAIGLFDDY